MMESDRREQRLKRDTVGDKAWPGKETNAVWGIMVQVFQGELGKWRPGRGVAP